MVNIIFAQITVNYAKGQLQRNVMFCRFHVLCHVGALTAKEDTMKARIQLRPRATTRVAQTR